MIRKILELDTATRSDRYRMFHRLPSEYAAVPRTLNGAARRKVRPREEREQGQRQRQRDGQSTETHTEARALYPTVTC